MNNPIKDEHPYRKVRRGRGYARAEYGATNSSRLYHPDISVYLGFRIVKSKS